RPGAGRWRWIAMVGAASGSSVRRWSRISTDSEEAHSHRTPGREDGFWDRRRPRHLFSGLLKCGSCGGGFVKISKEHFGCATAPNKGTCDNRLAIRRDELEAAVLDGLQHHLMDPALCDVFAEEYVRHLNRLRMEHNAALARHRAELIKITKETERLIQAILDGVPGAQVKDRMILLDARKSELERLLADADEEPVLLHPDMGRRYRREVAALRDALNDDGRRIEAAELVRALVDRIVLTPVGTQGRSRLSIDLHGALAGILALAQDKQKPATVSRDGLEQVKLVAGACNSRCRHPLKIPI
ncbi:zinc ribbon domain-containing protein, partial [Azospirillum sp. TSO22-1]|uniref:zinc ribbon domain-containing protein n=1 Tax=Azospirillum sp. TSO22-1 TaxID=716789 RepID=UPI0018EEB825